MQGLCRCPELRIVQCRLCSGEVVVLHGFVEQWVGGGGAEVGHGVGHDLQVEYAFVVDQNESFVSLSIGNGGAMFTSQSDFVAYPDKTCECFSRCVLPNTLLRPPA